MTFSILLISFTLIVLVQALSTLWLTIWVWQDPNRLEAIKSPTRLLPARHTFTAILPARDEVAVIGGTLQRLSEVAYPDEMLEILVVCHTDDRPTIAAARQAIRRVGRRRMRVVVFDDGPLNKPHALNVGLAESANEIVVIIDAESDVAPELISVIDTVYQQKDCDIVQGGVQLMNYRSRWYSVHNVLEYYFWFKSRMHAHARAGVVPLGGNTVAFRTEQLRSAGGWHEGCLTEDAEIGIRLTADGAKVHAMYDPRHVTREETPDDIRAFVRQRTRWNQGFLQILRGGEWKKFPSKRKRALCIYLMVVPLVYAFLGIAALPLFAVGFFMTGPIALSVASYIPGLIVLLQVVVSAAGLIMLCQEQSIRLSARTLAGLPFTFFAYQVLLTVSAIRAVTRFIRGEGAWEKTSHRGQHRTEEQDLQLASLGRTAGSAVTDVATVTELPRQRAAAVSSGDRVSEADPVGNAARQHALREERQ